MKLPCEMLNRNGCLCSVVRVVWIGLHDETKNVAGVGRVAAVAVSAQPLLLVVLEGLELVRIRKVPRPRLTTVPRHFVKCLNVLKNVGG